ncbi:MAG TPA: hypothetical protein VH255_08205, partial [Verrucomicrobiae bacterium]|nr:hypothetical protein [Verrucomicrobiae bacterium]
MNAYVFTGAVTQSQMRPAPIGRGRLVDQMVTWDNILSHIFCANSLEEAETLFKDHLSRQQPGENPIQTEFRYIVGAQLINELLTEA